MQQHEEAEGSLNSGERHAQALVEFEVEEPLLPPTPRVQVRVPLVINTNAQSRRYLWYLNRMTQTTWEGSLTGTLSHQNDADDVGSHRSYRLPMASNGLLTSHRGLKLAALGYSQFALTNLQWLRMASNGLLASHRGTNGQSSATRTRAHTQASEHSKALTVSRRVMSIRTQTNNAAT